MFDLQLQEYIHLLYADDIPNSVIQKIEFTYYVWKIWNIRGFLNSFPVA